MVPPLGKRARTRALAELSRTDGVLAATQVPPLPLPLALPYVVVDVFTTDDRAFTGNPLAVVFDAEGLSGEQLQAIAAEFNLSETTFPMRPTDTGRADGADYRLRIFTPGVELPFAGHPSVGTAWVQAVLGRSTARDGQLRMECGIGVLPLRLHDGGLVELTGGPPQVGPPVPAEPLLAACGLAAGDLAGPPPRVCSTGFPMPFLLVGPEAVARAVPDVAAITGLAAQYGSGELVVLSIVDREVHCRVFPCGAGITEDPATGSAATSMGAYLVASGMLPGDGTTAFTISQGREIGRPSALFASVDAAGGVATACRVAGRVAAVARGEITVPRAPAAATG